MNKLSIQGKEINSDNVERDFSFDGSTFNIVQSVKVNALRGDTEQIKIDGKEEDIVHLVFDDNAEWIGPIEDIAEIYGLEYNEKRGKSEDELVLPTQLGNAGERGIAEWGIKLLNVFRKRVDLPVLAGKKLGQVLDQKLMPNPGLFRLNADFNLEAFDDSAGNTDLHLLFIHGTISSTSGSFGHIYKVNENDSSTTSLWQQVQSTYGQNVLALEHRTVSVHPVQNVIDVLEGIPNNATLDIISHSRGGIVADLLSRCDRRNDIIGFSDEELLKIKKEDTDSYQLLQKLNTLLEHKRITVRKVIRVACPAYGTLLLSARLDHFLNGLLRAVGLLFGSEANRIYAILREFIMDVVKSRTQPGTLPGLLSMVPGSPLQDVLNNLNTSVKSHLVTIEGNSEFGGSVGHSIKVIFSNLFYRRANDFVVNTDSMRLGVRRESGLQYVLSKDSDTSHFNYFKNDHTRNFILSALTAAPGSDINGFNRYPLQGTERGILLDFINLGEERGTRITGNKPIVILIPGIMGSNIEAYGKKIWLDFGEIGKGKLADDIYREAPKVTASSLIGKYYSPLVKALRDDYDVEVFPYDWRNSLKEPAEKLKDKIEELSAYGQEVKIIAHSMGGLLTRTMMMEHAAEWKEFIEKKGSQFLMLGTPWKGSYGIMELLTGKAASLRQLALADILHTKGELMEVIGNFPGVYELLPVDDRNLETHDFWKQIENELEEPLAVKKSLLEDFSSYKQNVQEASFDFTDIYYIAGTGKSTIEDYEIVSSVFGKRLKFTKTTDGDGTVTWEKGIPEGMPSENVYYVDVPHGDLAKDDSSFEGIRDILKMGQTNILPTAPIQSRGAVEADTDIMVSNYLGDAADIIFGAYKVADSNPIKQETLHIEVTHAELKVSKYPIIVGHFENDDLVSAERAIDIRFDGNLTDRHAVGNYPESVGSNIILFNPEKQPKGAVVVGLGNPTKLTAHHLMNTVRAGILNYAMFIRDNCFHEEKQKFSSGISSLCVGAGYGRVPLENALQAILIGIVRANETMEALNDNLVKIDKVQLVEIYEDRANEAYYCLKRIAKSQSQLVLNIQKGVGKSHGARKRLLYDRQEVWWHNFSTQKVLADESEDSKARLLFRSSSGIARVEQKNTYTSEEVVNALLSEFSKSDQWDPEMSKTLFELLIPIDFKEIIRSQNNILWKMDVNTASIPWEMFHDIEYDEDPTFINAGLIRQLTTENFRRNPNLIRSNTALVIGDPMYGGDLPQLNAAMNEAVDVHGLLAQAGFDSREFIRKNGTEILKSVYNQEFRVLHIAGHGIFDPDNDNIGVALGNGMFLSPSMIGNFSKVPQFVFLNCCHSGYMDSKYEKYYEDRYRFAANIGTELIKLGTEAVIVTGWAVGDDPAKLFAMKFYELMLEGYPFGEAVQKARHSCYKKYPKSNTWGAYQCYGNPWYKMVSKSTRKHATKNYLSSEEVWVDLENLMVETININLERVQSVKEKLERIIAGAKDAGLYSGPVIEKEARVYNALDEIDLAVDRYFQLLSLNKADFKVSSLEQFCNLRAKQMVRKDSRDASTMSKILKDLKLMLSIGETPERLSLVGSANKRFAQVSSGKRQARFLDQMMEKYQKSFHLQKDQIKSAIYPLTNWLTGLALTDPEGTVEIDDRKWMPAEYLEEVEKNLRNEIITFSDFWEDINMVNVKMCQMLFSTDKALIRNLRLNVVHHYLHAWHLGGSFNKARTEIEHIDFVIAMASDKTDFQWKTKIEQLQEIKSKLEELMSGNVPEGSDTLSPNGESTKVGSKKMADSDQILNE